MLVVVVILTSLRLVLLKKIQGLVALGAPRRCLLAILKVVTCWASSAERAAMSDLWSPPLVKHGDVTGRTGLA